MYFLFTNKFVKTVWFSRQNLIYFNKDCNFQYCKIPKNLFSEQWMCSNSPLRFPSLFTEFSLKPSSWKSMVHFYRFISWDIFSVLLRNILVCGENSWFHAGKVFIISIFSDFTDVFLLIRARRRKYLCEIRTWHD